MTREPDRTHPHTSAAVAESRTQLAVSVYPGRCVVDITGELDLTSGVQLFEASTAGHQPTIVINLAGVTFMNCSGFGALVASRQTVEGEGRLLFIRGATGQPAQLLDLIAESEGTRRAVGF